MVQYIQFDHGTVQGTSNVLWYVSMFCGLYCISLCFGVLVIQNKHFDNITFSSSKLIHGSYCRSVVQGCISFRYVNLINWQPRVYSMYLVFQSQKNILKCYCSSHQHVNTQWIPISNGNLIPRIVTLRQRRTDWTALVDIDTTAAAVGGCGLLVGTFPACELVVAVVRAL